MRCFEDNLERHWLNLRGGCQHAFVMIIDNPIPRCETIYGRLDISGNNLLSLAQSGTQQMLGQRMASNKAVNAFAGIIGMELD